MGRTRCRSRAHPCRPDRRDCLGRRLDRRKRDADHWAGSATPEEVGPGTIVGAPLSAAKRKIISDAALTGVMAPRRLVGELAMPRNVSDLVLLVCIAAFLSGV